MPRPLIAEPAKVSAYKREFGPLAKDFQAYLKMPRKQAVVGIQKNQEPARAVTDAGISRRPKSAIAIMPNVSNIRILPDDLLRPVRRCIINHYDLVIGMRLPQNTFNSLVKEMTLLITGNDDVDREFIGAE